MGVPPRSWEDSWIRSGGIMPWRWGLIISSVFGGDNPSSSLLRPWWSWFFFGLQDLDLFFFCRDPLPSNAKYGSNLFWVVEGPSVVARLGDCDGLEEEAWPLPHWVSLVEEWARALSRSRDPRMPVKSSESCLFQTYEKLWKYQPI